MRVLVLGASGFLGRWVTRALLDEQHEVRVLARSPERLGDLQELALEVCEGDILEKDSLNRAMQGAQAVINCAACVSLKLRDRELIHEVNVVGTRNVIEAAASHHSRVVHSSSIGAVGPANEPEVLDETSPRLELDFDYPYVASKCESEDLALQYAAAGHDVTVLNPGIMLGPDDQYFSSTDFVLHYLRGEVGVHLPGGGSFCDVRDVASAYVTSLERAERGERYILAGINREYGEVMDELQQLTGLRHTNSIPPVMAELTGWISQLSAQFWAHPLEKFNVSVARWGALYNYCSSAKAEQHLGYRNRNFTRTLIDTIVDLLWRGSARPRTPELRALMDGEITADCRVDLA